jgi:hypothetical protein
MDVQVKLEKVPYPTHLGVTQYVDTVFDQEAVDALVAGQQVAIVLLDGDNRVSFTWRKRRVT